MNFDEYFNARWPEFNHPKTSAREIWDAAQAAEREECARICDRCVDIEHPTVNGHIMKGFAASAVLAAAIRARSEK